MKEIPLTQGQFALVDDDDFKELNQHKWYASLNTGTNSFYAVRSIGLKCGKWVKLRMNRIVMSCDIDLCIDHINHNTLDNRKLNLRIVTKSQNGMNQRRRNTNKSGITGVTWCDKRNKWRAHIVVDRKQKHLGRFTLKKDAINARVKAEDRYHGEYSYNNSINKEVSK